MTYTIFNSLLLIVLVLFSPASIAKDEEPPSIGNFSVRSSQQPGSLICFGENIFDKGTFQVNLGGNLIKGSDQYTIEALPNAVYALTDDSSILLSAPYAIQFNNGDSKSSGFEDMVVQYEYAFKNTTNSCFADLGTIVMNISLPTGSTKKQPATGNGAATYFLGFAFLRTYVDWLLFTSQGAQITSSHHGTKFGNNFQYQFGIGRNLAFEENKWVFDWILELTGQYTEKNRIVGQIDPDSGGNVAYLTPSLWFSTQNLIFQMGIGTPIIQKLWGSQQNNDYILIGNLAWTF